MPFDPNASKEEMFEELGKGKTYARTKKKGGRKKANKQRVAIVLSAQRKAEAKKKHRKHAAGKK